MNYKMVAAFAAGGIVGGLGTFFGVKGYFEKKAEDEIQEMKEYYLEKKRKEAERFEQERAELARTVEMVIPEDAIEEIKKHFEVTSPSLTFFANNNPVEKAKPGTVQTPYSTMYRGSQEKPSLEELAKREYPREEDEDPDENDPRDYVEFTGETTEPPEDELPDGMECVREPRTAELPPPYEISESEFASDWRFEKINITYYEGDDTLADEDESMMDEGAVGGHEVFEHFDEDNVVYVRNERLGIDYEIFKKEGFYSEEVLGITDEEVGRRRPIKKRKRKLNDE